MEAERLNSITHAYFGSLADPDTDEFVALFSPDVHFEDPVESHMMHGHDGVAKFHRGLHKAWSSLQMSVHDVHPRGNRVAVRWSATGHSATGKDISFDGIDVIEVDDDGKIARLEGYWDLEGVIAQM